MKKVGIFGRSQWRLPLLLFLLFLLLLRRTLRSGGPLIRPASPGGRRGRSLPSLGRGTDSGRLDGGGLDALRLDPGAAAISTRAIEQATDGLVGSVAGPLRSGIGASLNGPSGIRSSAVGPGETCPPGVGPRPLDSIDSERSRPGPTCSPAPIRKVSRQPFRIIMT